ncbi:MAG: SDR family oxidoreductase [Ardenticatenales bacterium]|nr:SDR family oxidoreductase [Ardenticatenales bacterium]
MRGKVCLVTGATAGIGKVTAQGLAVQGATVILVGRDAAKGQAIMAQIKEATGNVALEFLRADLSIQSEIRQLAQEVLARYDRLDVLVNNAGAVFQQRLVTKDGYEMTFALNHLAYFLLTHLLLERLKASAPARIVNVSSDAHQNGQIAWDDPQLERTYSMWPAYQQSKFANVLFTYELARRLEGTGVTANVLHPGFVASNFGKNNGFLGRLVMPIVHLFAINETQGSETSIYLASSPDVEGVTGKYFVKKKATPSTKGSYDEAAARRLWGMSEQLTGITTPA